MFEAPSHWLIVALVVIALFGYKKLPDAARSLGRSLRIFRTEIKGIADDDQARAASASGTIEASPLAIATAPHSEPIGNSDGGDSLIMNAETGSRAPEGVPISSEGPDPRAGDEPPAAQHPKYRDDVEQIRA